MSVNSQNKQFVLFQAFFIFFLTLSVSLSICLSVYLSHFFTFTEGFCVASMLEFCPDCRDACSSPKKEKDTSQRARSLQSNYKEIICQQSYSSCFFLPLRQFLFRKNDRGKPCFVSEFTLVKPKRVRT